MVAMLLVASCGGDAGDPLQVGAGAPEAEPTADAVTPDEVEGADDVLRALPLAPRVLTGTVQIDDIATGAAPIDTSACPTPWNAEDLTPPSEFDDDALWEFLDEMIAGHDELVAVRDAGFRPRHVLAEGQVALALEWPGADACQTALDMVADPSRVVWIGPLHMGAVWGRQDLPLQFWLIQRALEAAAVDDQSIWRSVGVGAADVITVGLAAGHDQLAGDLLARFGPLVQITVGGAPYPPDGTTYDDCLAIPAHTARAGLAVTDTRVIDLDWGEQVEFTVTNDTAAAVHLGLDRMAVLAEPGGSRTRSAFLGAMTLELRGTTPIEPGASVTVTATLGTDLCAFDGSAYAVEPGVYDVVLVARVHDQPSSETDPSDELLVMRGSYEVS